MKTRNHFRTLVPFKVLICLLVMAAMQIVITSCNDVNRPEKVIAAPVPPPPSPKAVSDSVYNTVDEMPVFAGGEAGILKYIKDNTVYPAEAVKNKITGKVFVKFIVGKDCSISDVKILKGVDQLLDTEAIRVVRTLPEFEKPAIKDGNPVSVQYIVPITFALKLK